MLQLKNLEGHIIILYDTDELIATQCATTMAQRGFENIFVVSHFCTLSCCAARD